MMRGMDAQITDRQERHRYELTVDGQKAGQINYRMVYGDIELIHTEVDPAYEGKGLAGQLAKFALDDARTRGLKVIPSCEYVRKYLERHPEYADLVKS